jgi:hypothetical protein
MDRMSFQTTLDDLDVSVQKKRRKALQELLPNYEILNFSTVYMMDKIWLVMVLYRSKKTVKIGLFRFYNKNSRWIRIHSISFDSGLLERVRDKLFDFSIYLKQYVEHDRMVKEGWINE